MRTGSVAGAALLALLIAASAGAVAVDMQVSVFPDRARYRPGDTAILIFDIDIPRGYYLYGNPVGPGPGKPLELDVVATSGIQPLGVRAGEPRRIGDGDDWVWAYRNRVSLYALLRITRSRSGKLNGVAWLHGLICREACEPVGQRLEFRLAVDTHGESPRPFSNARLHRLRFSRSQWFAGQGEAAANAAVAGDSTASDEHMVADAPQEGDASLPVASANTQQRQVPDVAIVDSGIAIASAATAHSPDVEVLASPQHAVEWDYTPIELRSAHGKGGGRRATTLLGALALLCIAVICRRRIVVIAAACPRRVYVTLLLLTGIALGVTFISRLPSSKAFPGRGSLAHAAAGWETFRHERLLLAHANGRHSLILFSAPLYKSNSDNVSILHSKKTMQLVENKDVMTFYADMKSADGHAHTLLAHLGASPLPLLAIFPGDDPYSPLLLRGRLQKKQVQRILSALPDK